MKELRIISKERIFLKEKNLIIEYRRTFFFKYNIIEEASKGQS